MALFGGQRRNTDWGRIGTFLLSGTNGLDRRDLGRQRMMEEEQLRQQTALSDRLRAQLSPADGPNGSGTGSAPSVEQQMAALNEARLLNPAVADQFAPFVQGNQRQQDAQRLFANDPKAQALYSMGNQSFLDSLGEQYKPQIIAEGGIQSVYGEGATVRNPRTREFGNSLVRDTPTGIETLATRGPTYSEQASLQNAGTAAANAGFTLGRDQTRFDPSGNPVAAVSAPQISNQAQTTAALEAINNTRAAITRGREQANFWTTGPLSALPLNTPARNLNATLDTIKANLSFNELAKMRANSPTGGALGSIAVRELDLLGSTVASLDQAQSQEELERSFGIIEQSLGRWEQAVRASQSQGQGQSQGSQQNDRSTRALEILRRRGRL